MSIQKKSLISKGRATKKARVSRSKPQVSKVAQTKTTATTKMAVWGN